jgi:DNA-binding protein HU-beta
MNKSELIKDIASKLSQNENLVEQVIDTFEATIIENLQHGEEVTLTGFGAFVAKYRHARKGVNPQNPSETIDVPAVTVPKFKAGKNLKDALKKVLQDDATTKSEPASSSVEDTSREPASTPAPAPTAEPSNSPETSPEPEQPVSENDGNLSHM